MANEARPLAVPRPEIIPAAPEHIAHIVRHVRAADKDEFAALDRSPEEALRFSLWASLVAWTGTVDGVPVCMFGVCPGGNEMEGRPWMIGTEDLDAFAVIFLRRCRLQVARMLQVRPVLVNYVSAENTRAIEWLTWLGFTIEAPIPCEPRGALFHRFSMKTKAGCRFSEPSPDG